MLVMLATPAAAELRIPCLWNPFGGCSITLVSPEYAARPVQALNPEAALAEVNAFRAENGLKPLVLDARLSRAAAMQSEAQAGRSWIGHYGSDGSTPMARTARAGFHAKIASENVASGQKSFSDVMHFWKESSGHRTNLLRPNVTAAGVAMAEIKAAVPTGRLSSAPNRPACLPTKRTYPRLSELGYNAGETEVRRRHGPQISPHKRGAEGAQIANGRGRSVPAVLALDISSRGRRRARARGQGDSGSVLAITGGTGEFAGATGEMALSAIGTDGKAYNFTYKIK